jgi:hypothetical protein
MANKRAKTTETRERIEQHELDTVCLHLQHLGCSDVLWSATTHRLEIRLADMQMLLRRLAASQDDDGGVGWSPDMCLPNG